MELKNETLFFVGIVLMILGSFIVIFDYPQIQFLEMANSESKYKIDIHQRLIIEFTAGIGIIGLGIGLFIVSFLKEFKYRFR
ncbi:MAG: hypothetical protein HKP31_08595 [Nitrosopumilus sp.]|nr:hypothetical protein [Nitrosopumilus sp.]